MKRVFLDATCWVASARSPGGGSSAILDYARAGALRIVTSNQVLLETERNTRNKMKQADFQRYMTLFTAVRPEVMASVTQEEWARWLPLVPAKDCHVLAGAVKAQADALVTLDRKHLLTATVRAGFPIPVQDTKEFLAAWRGEQTL